MISASRARILVCDGNVANKGNRQRSNNGSRMCGGICGGLKNICSILGEKTTHVLVVVCERHRCFQLLQQYHLIARGLYTRERGIFFHRSMFDYCRRSTSQWDQRHHRHDYDVLTQHVIALTAAIIALGMPTRCRFCFEIIGDVYVEVLAEGPFKIRYQCTYLFAVSSRLLVPRYTNRCRRFCYLPNSVVRLQEPQAVGTLADLCPHLK